jgi:GAF domain-containing protein
LKDDKLSYPVPPNEFNRLAKLYATGVLYTEATQNFDRLTNIAVQLFEVPIALVSFVDAHQQWFKSKVGTEICSTLRDQAFCSHAILGNELLVVRDASKDERFRDYAIVRGPPFVKFYAGAPIVLGVDIHVGTICILDHRPRDLHPVHRLVLQDMAKTCATELRLMLAFKKIQELLRRESAQA